MTRTFCDACGQEILKLIGKTGRLEGKALNKKIMIQVVTGSGSGTWNDGHFCVQCIVNAVCEVGVQE